MFRGGDDPGGLEGEGAPYRARIRLFLGLCSSSARPSASMSGGTYIANRPR